MTLLEEGTACAKTWRWLEHVGTFFWSDSRGTGNEAHCAQLWTVESPTWLWALTVYSLGARKMWCGQISVSHSYFFLPDYGLPKVCKVLLSKPPVPGTGVGMYAKNIQWNFNELTFVAQHLAVIWNTCPGCALFFENGIELQDFGNNLGKQTFSLTKIFFQN